MREQKKRNRKMITSAVTFGMAALLLTACGSKDSTSVKLDPEHPVSLTIWHYYNGTQQATFDELIEEFNATVGQEKGIYVEGYSYGSVSDLEAAVSAALNGEVGASELPDIFSSYADTAYAAQKEDKLADLTQYYTEDELNSYVDSYIKEGYFNDDGALYLMPVAKSTEVMLLNKTDWEPFAEATGSTLDELKTLEGVVQVAQRYYEWTDAQTPDVEGDGKAFYGRDSMSNYFVIGMRQMGQEIFEVHNGEVTLNTDRELLHRLWENYYVPYVKGYFAAYGRFRSDDAKTGDILAYTGSTSSAMYFPDAIEENDQSYPIECLAMEAPIMEGGENVRVQQGAGMAVTKSDPEHEYASCVFLKWFTQQENNMRFVCDSGYMPVLKEANSIEALDEVIQKDNLEISSKTYQCLKTVMQSADSAQYYTTKSFKNGYQTRKVLDYNLSDQAAADREAIEAAVAAGADREEEIAGYTSEESFENWYQGLCEALKQAAAGE